MRVLSMPSTYPANVSISAPTIDISAGGVDTIDIYCERVDKNVFYRHF